MTILPLSDLAAHLSNELDLDTARAYSVADELVSEELDDESLEDEWFVF
jgi:hypothetical protein